MRLLLLLSALLTALAGGGSVAQASVVAAPQAVAATNATAVQPTEVAQAIRPLAPVPSLVAILGAGPAPFSLATAALPSTDRLRV